MKVGTDSLLLGSWAVGRLKQDGTGMSTLLRCLDIGAGSGLLSLMLAQWAGRNMQGLAIEIDPKACEQARQNIASSPWRGAIDVLLADAREFSAAKTFDVIISNPPYFPEETLPKNAFEQQTSQRRIARNQHSLSVLALCKIVAKMLAPRGKFFVVLPASEAQELELAIQTLGLFRHATCRVSTMQGKPASRLLIQIGKSPEQCTFSDLNVYTAERVYTEEYKTVCKDYYLNF
jgi:tRNA1Val (adenine37-N6)-methyltransferase